MQQACLCAQRAVDEIGVEKGSAPVSPRISPCVQGDGKTRELFSCSSVRIWRESLKHVRVVF